MAEPRFAVRPWLFFWRAVAEASTGRVVAVCRPASAESVRCAMEALFGARGGEERLRRYEAALRRVAGQGDGFGDSRWGASAAGLAEIAREALGGEPAGPTPS